MFSAHKKRSYRRLLASCIFSLSLITTPIALAEYQQPAEPSAPQEPTGTTGPRGGCRTNSATSLTALAPYSHVGQTISTSPTVAWFVPDSESIPLEFSLYEYEGKNKHRILFQELASSPGTMHISLPNLSVGKRYLWQVVLLCNPNRPSDAIVVRAEIEVVAAPSSLAAKLNSTTDPIEKAQIYAEFGFWYDAFGSVLELNNDLRAKDLQLSLLDTLSRLEAFSDLEYIKKQRLQLEQIVQLEREFNH